MIPQLDLPNPLYLYRTPTQSVIDQLIALAREIFNLCTNLFCSLFLNTSQWGEISETGDQGLIVFLHGINSAPRIWRHHITILKRDYPQFKIYAPLISNRGVDNAVKPILQKIRDFNDTHPTFPIQIFGHSFGTLLASRIECILREEAPHIPVRISAIAGVYLGSPRVDMVFASKILPSSIRGDLRYQGAAVTYLREQFQSPLPEGVVREHEFYAAREDFAVPLDSSLPATFPGRKVALNRYGHSSIIRAIAADQIATAVEWFKRFLT